MTGLEILAIAGGLLEFGGWVAGQIGESEARSEDLQNRRIQASYKASLWDLNEDTIKASYHRNMRALMLNEGIQLGRQASALASANIGVAGTSVPAFRAVMEKTDFDASGYEMQKMKALGQIAINRSASKASLASLKEWGSTMDMINTGLEGANLTLKTINDYNEQTRRENAV